jgi:hypothetical protein
MELHVSGFVLVDAVILFLQRKGYVVSNDFGSYCTWNAYAMYPFSLGILRIIYIIVGISLGIIIGETVKWLKCKIVCRLR